MYADIKSIWLAISDSIKIPFFTIENSNREFSIKALGEDVLIILILISLFMTLKLLTQEA